MWKKEAFQDNLTQGCIKNRDRYWERRPAVALAFAKAKNLGEVQEGYRVRLSILRFTSSLHMFV